MRPSSLLCLSIVFFATATTLDLTSTFLGMNVETPVNIEIVETHPLGYPNCFLNLLLQIPMMLVAFCVRKREGSDLRDILTYSMLGGSLALFYAAVNNMLLLLRFI